MTNHEDKREFLRAHENIYLEFRVLSDSEEADLFHKMSIKSSAIETDSELNEIIRVINIHIESIQKSSPEIAACLSALDHKIDLLRQLKYPLHTERIHNEPNHHVNISAGGLSFLTTEKIKTGNILELKLILTPDSHFLNIYGTVIHTDHTKTDKDNTNLELNRIGVKFHHLTEAERDTLVQYSLTRERELIQKNKSSSQEE